MNKRHKNKTLILLSFLSALISCYTLLLPQNANAAASICARVKIEIRQELTLERQAFDAHMRITNGLDIVTLEDVNIDINFTDEEGNAVVASSDPDNTSALFYIRVDSTENIDDVNGAGTVQPETTADIHWLIIPAPGSSNGLEMGTLYYVGATLTYTIGGEQEVTEVSPDYIFVKPMPELTLDYFLPSEVYGDDAFTDEIEPIVPFSLGVRVKNTGAGRANNLKIESAQPKIVENEQGLLIGFNIEGSEVNGQDATDSLLADFGDIEPNSSGIARWIMTVTLSGQFVEFDAEYTHADELGGKLTSLINDPINTHFLVHDVLVDLSGRDNIRDFLAKDGGVYRVYESESIDTEVTDQTASSNLQYTGQTSTEISYILSTPVTAGFMYVKLPDPQNGQQKIKRVLRSDGKYINEENTWLSKTRDESDNWVYYINIFDDNTTDTYTVVFEDPYSGPQPPVLQFIPDRSGFENQQISFIVEASDPNGTVPMLSGAPLPAGATFTDQGDRGNGIATGIFDWTPSAGQSGRYEITFKAFDGLYTDIERAIITINSGTDIDGDGMPDDWETNNFGDITRDGTGDYDKDGLTDLDEYLLGTDPTNPDTDGDGMPDGWEEAHGLNPKINDAAEDPDNDGYSNIEEYQGGSDPFDTQSIPDQVPVANAGPDQNAKTGERVTLDGSESKDPERAMITLHWTFTEVPPGSLVNNASLTDTAGAKPEFIPDLNGTYRLRLTVNNGVSDSIQDEVLITATGPNVAPNADAGPDRNALTGSLINIDGSRSNDPDSGPESLSYQWSFEQLPAASSLRDIDIIDNTLTRAGFTPDQEGIYILKLTVSDSEKRSEDRVEITTTTTRVPPNADAGDDTAITLSLTAVLLDGSASNDPDGQQGLTYGWSFVAIPGGSSITNSDLAGADRASPSFTPDTEGTYVLGLIVSDGQNTDSDNTAVTVRVSALMPVISVLPEGLDLGSVSVGSSSTAQTLTIINAGSSDLEIYSINMEGRDASMFNAASETCLNLTPVIAPGENCTISVIFSPSSTGAKSADLSIESGDPYNPNVTISLSGTGMNTPPAADAGGPYTGMEGQAITFDGSGSTDLNGDAFQYQWDFDNDGTWDSGWTSSPIAENVWNDDWSGTVKLEVSDGEFSDTDTVTVTVNNVAPNVEAGPEQNINEGETVDFAGSFSDPGADTHTIVWNFGDGSPQAETLSETHQYADDGEYTASLTVTDDDGGTGTDTLTITVNNIAPMADNKTVTLDEDVTIAVVLTASDPGDDELSFIVVDNPANGLLTASLPNVTYRPNPDFNGTDSFTYKANDGAEDSNIATVTITVNAINDAPVATNDTAMTDEDNPVTIAVTGNDNAGPPDEDQTLTITTVTQGTNGMVINMGDGTVNYIPNQDDNGTDSFSYTISDSEGLSDTATVKIIINAINDAPDVSTDTNSQTVQYSDEIALVTITASDIDSSVLQVSTSWTKDGGAEQAGLPDGLSLNIADCTGNLEVTCIRVLGGKSPEVSGEYNIVIAMDDGEIVGFAFTTINVETEDLDLEFDDGNPIAIEVAEAGGNSGIFNLRVHIREMQPDFADRAAYPGDISLADVSMSLQPAGPGSPVSGECSVDMVSGSGYEAVKTVMCGFDNVPVSTYTVDLTVKGNYYEGYGEDVVVIYDSGLGYVTGGGWFYWPGTEDIDSGYPGDRTNFGFTMTYDEDGTNVQGDFLLISHLPDGTIYRIKSNALYGLSIGDMHRTGKAYDWSSFSGKSTYLEPEWLEPAGNYEFTVYMEDHEKHKHGDGTDRFWIELVDQDGNVINDISMPSPASNNTEKLEGGEIIIPHDRQCRSRQR